MRNKFGPVVKWAFALVPLLGLAAIVQGQPRTVRIGVVIDGPWERNDQVRDLIQREVRTLTEDEFDVQFPSDKIITSDWTLAGVTSEIDQLLSDPSVDLLLTMGVLASQVVSSRTDLSKPVIAPFVIDAGLQGLPSKEGATGVKNLNYLSMPARAVSEIRLFREIVPFESITILLNKEAWDSISDLSTRVRTALQEIGITPILLPVERSIDSTLRALTPETEAVYIAPLLHLVAGDFERLVQDLIAKKIPSFALLGVSRVELGILAAAAGDFFPRVARRIALNVQRILLGEDAGSLPTAFAIGERIFINDATARAIGVSPSFSIITEAVLINEEKKQVDRIVNLSTVLQEAVEKNLELAAEGQFVAAGRQNIRVARSQLFPQLGLSSTGLLIDEDRAAASFGSQAQRTWTGSISGSQLVFSEPAWANLSIQKHVQDSREHEYRALRLDIAQDASITYLNVLRAKTFEAVQKDNLKRTRSNLEHARVREAIGQANRSEVFRWESEIASARKNVIESIAQRNVAEIALNRLLHRPLEESFATEETGVDDPAVAISNQRMLDYYDDPISFDTFRNFMVVEGLRQSPEIQSLEAAVAAKDRELRSASRAFWSPTVALQAEISNLLDEGGAGVSSPFSDLPPDISNMFPPVTEADDTNWSIALNFSIPIFEGGSRFARRARARDELEELRLTREAVVERIEQRVRTTLHVAGASRAGIQLSRDASDAADKNLGLVTDAYSRGVLDILDLLDAQNSALNADLAAANAVYDFLIDILEVERAIGGFYYFASQQERSAWFQRLQEFFETAGVSPRGR